MFFHSMNKTLVHIADNHILTRTGTISILNQHHKNKIVFKEFSRKEILFDALRDDQPHLLIIDFDLIDFESLAEFAQIKNIAPKTGVLVITENQDPETVSSVIENGFSVYVLKSCTEQELLNGYTAALSSSKYFSCGVLDVILEIKTRPKVQQEPIKLTISEIEIVKFVVQGLTTKEIAARKCLSFHTVITHRKNIFRKLSIKSTSELMLYAMRNGLIDPPEYHI